MDWPTEAAVVMRQLRHGDKKLPSGTMGWASDRFNLQPPGEPVIVVASILTNHDTDEYLEKARKRIENITLKDENESNRLVRKTEKNGFVGLELKGNYLVLVFEGDSEEVCMVYIDKIFKNIF